MKDSRRLTFVSDKSQSQLNELWQNCFEDEDNLQHMNEHVPIPVTHQWQIDGFLNHEHNYLSWLIKRIEEGDIIGFVIHGDFFPGLPNNVGLNIGLNYTGKGYATETMECLLEYIRESGSTETYGHCLETNRPSIMLMERCGFERVGPTGKSYGGRGEIKFKINLT